MNRVHRNNNLDSEYLHAPEGECASNKSRKVLLAAGLSLASVSLSSLVYLNSSSEVAGQPVTEEKKSTCEYVDPATVERIHDEVDAAVDTVIAERIEQLRPNEYRESLPDDMVIKGAVYRELGIKAIQSHSPYNSIGTLGSFEQAVDEITELAAKEYGINVTVSPEITPQEESIYSTFDIQPYSDESISGHPPLRNLAQSLTHLPKDFVQDMGLDGLKIKVVESIERREPTSDTPETSVGLADYKSNTIYVTAQELGESAPNITLMHEIMHLFDYKIGCADDDDDRQYIATDAHIAPPGVRGELYRSGVELPHITVTNYALSSHQEDKAETGGLTLAGQLPLSALEESVIEEKHSIILGRIYENAPSAALKNVYDTHYGHGITVDAIRNSEAWQKYEEENLVVVD